MLTKEDATAICNVVANDPEASKRIASDIAAALPSSWGMSGGVRNLGYVALGMVTFGKLGDPTDAEYADRVCTGIADATAAAINNAVSKRVAAVRRVAGATTVDRVLNSVAHTATRISMVDGQVHVFDWHATLEANNPMMFQKVSDWLQDKNGVTLEEFVGWK